MRRLFDSICMSAPARARARERECVRAFVPARVRAYVHVMCGRPSVNECAVVRLFVSFAVGLARNAAFV